MEFFSSNFSSAVTGSGVVFGSAYVAFLSVIDIATLVVGQPLMAKLLWISWTSRKTADILSLNLGVFHNVHYWICTVHLSLLHLQTNMHTNVLKFLFVYSQIGGSMNLSFICMERYVAVIYPMSYPLLKKYRFREVGAAAVWLASVPMSFISVFATETTSPMTDVLATLPFVWVVIMTVMVVHSSVSITKVLKKSGVGNAKMHPGKNKAFKTVLVTMYIVMICYVPLTVLQRLAYADQVKEFYIVPIGVCFLCVASVAHPLHHLSSQGKLFNFLKPKKKAK